jgi:hypothetical protein
VFAFERSVFDSPGALRADLCRPNPVDPCAKYHQSDAGHRRAACRPNHRSYHAPNDGDHYAKTKNQTTEEIGNEAHSTSVSTLQLLSSKHSSINDADQLAAATRPKPNLTRYGVYRQLFWFAMDRRDISSRQFN